MKINSIYKKILETYNDKKLNNWLIILFSATLILPVTSYLLLRLLGLNLEPFIIDSNTLLNIHLCFTGIFCLVGCIFNFYGLDFKYIKKNLLPILGCGLLLGFASSLMTTLPVSSFFASILINKFENKKFEEVYLIEDQNIAKYRKYEAISLLDQQQYSFQMPARFGPQDDLTEGTTVKLRGIEGKLGRVITSYEVVKPAPAKN